MLALRSLLFIVLGALLSVCAEGHAEIPSGGTIAPPAPSPSVSPTPSTETQFDFNVEGSTPSENKVPEPEKPRQFHLGGSLNFEMGRELGRTPRWARLGSSLLLKSEWTSDFGLVAAKGDLRFNKAYDIERDPSAVRGKYGFERVLREFYWQKSFGEVTVTAGQVITIWGKGDYLSAVDVVTPLDQSSAFFANLDEAWLGQNTVKIDHYAKSWQTTLLYVPTARSNRYADAQHPYDFFGGVPRQDVKSNEDNQEVGVRTAHKFEKGSIAVMGGYFHSRDPILGKGSSVGIYDQKYPGFVFAGIAAEYGQDPSLLKFELGYSANKAQQKITGGEFDDFERIGVMKGLVGMDYKISNGGTVTVEGMRTQSARKREYLPSSPRLDNIALGWNDLFFRDRFKLALTAIFFDRIQNTVGRVVASQKLSDRSELKFQYSIIANERNYSRLAPYSEWDRADLTYSWNF